MNKEKLCDPLPNLTSLYTKVPQDSTLAEYDKIFRECPGVSYSIPVHGKDPIGA